MTQNETICNADFEVLAASLRHIHLPASRDTYRQAWPHEFMWMGRTSDGRIARFKHRGTRNYIHLYLPAGDIAIPVGGEFHGGYFGTEIYG